MKEHETTTILGIKVDEVKDNLDIQTTVSEDHIEYTNLRTGSKVVVNTKDENGNPKNVYINGKKVT